MRPEANPAIMVLCLLITLLAPTHSAATQLREMEYEVTTQHSFNRPRGGEVGFLYIETTITDLRANSTNMIIKHETVEPGLDRYRLALGIHILTFSADGFVPLSGIRLNVEERGSYGFRITPKAPLQPSFDPSGIRIGGDKPDWDPQIQQQHIVRFESDPPGAEVRIGGEYLCQTPCSRALPEGEHRIEMRLARHADHSETITISEPMTIRSALEPLFGWVSVRTEPSGLAIELNGKPIGKSPIVRHEVDPGRHTVKVVDPRYRVDGVEDFQVTGNQHRELPVFRPARRQGGLVIEAKDQRGNDLLARVEVNGRPVGKTFQTITLPVGEVEVKAHTDDYYWLGRLTIAEGATTRQRVRLEQPIVSAEERRRRELRQEAQLIYEQSFRPKRKRWIGVGLAFGGLGYLLLDPAAESHREGRLYGGLTCCLIAFFSVTYAFMEPDKSEEDVYRELLKEHNLTYGLSVQNDGSMGVTVAIGF